MSDTEIEQKDIINLGLKYQRDTLLWNVSNTENIIRWIATCNLKLLVIDFYLSYLKRILRVNTLWSLIISSITSTISATQFTISDISYPSVSLAIKIVIFVTSLFTSLITGYIKVEKIQETIERIEDNKNTVSNLLFSLLSEIQVTIEHRKPANILIKEKRDEFNNVSSKQFDIPSHVRNKISKFLVGKNIYNKKCCRKIKNKSLENAKKKLSLFNSVNKLLEKELLSLLIYYPEEINKILIYHESDIFKFKIITKDFNVTVEDINDKTGVYSEFIPSNKANKIFKKAHSINSRAHTFQSPTYSQQTPYSQNTTYQSQTYIPFSQPQVIEVPVEKVVEVPVEKIVEVPVEKVVEKIIKIKVNDDGEEILLDKNREEIKETASVITSDSETN